MEVGRRRGYRSGGGSTPRQRFGGALLGRHGDTQSVQDHPGLGTDWVPREMRHTFVSLLSSNGMAVEDIADLVGHRGTATTETVYRKAIVPELRRGAEVMDRLFT